MLRRYIGDKQFYKRVFTVALPMIIQNGITNFVSLLDNFMVGQISTPQMNGVAIVNQLLFVFNLCVFGALSGAGIFSAQFFGSKNNEGVRHSFRFKVLIGALLSILGITTMLTFGKNLIQLFLQGQGSVEDVALTFEFGWKYLLIMLWGLPAFALSNAYCSTLRESNQTFVPMVSGVCAVLVNLVLNYVLIFGKFGAPELGIEGAAIATVASRFVEMCIVVFWTHLHSKENPFIQGVYKSLYIPRKLLIDISVKGMPLLINEALWSVGTTVINQSYSLRSLDVVSALSISSTIYNMSSVVFMSLGGAVGIIMGQMLGAGESAEHVKEANRILIATSVASCILFALIMASCSTIFPQIYKTSDSIRSLATSMICICACMMPINAYTHSAYFTLRSGGQTFVTFLFDSCFMWVFVVPLAFVLSRFTALPIVPLYACVQAADFIKCGLGAYMIHKGTWIQVLADK